MDPSENPIESNQIQTKNPIKPNLGKLKKDGTPRKCNLTDEQKAKRAEILAKGRAIAHEKRRQLELSKKENPPTTKAIPEPSISEPPAPEQDVSEPETLKVMSIPKKKKKKGKKKIVIMDESSSSSSEEEVIVKKKSKSKRKPTPPPPPTPTPAPAPVAPPKPSIPEPTQEEMDKLRKEKIRRINEKAKKDRLMANIFG